MIPLVMAGGLGSRIRPLSANRPKPMLPVVNRPILEHVLLQLRDSGFPAAVLLTYHDADRIQAAFGDGSRLGMRLRYLVADQDWGTAGAVARGAEMVPDATILAVSGDVISGFDLKALVAAHRDRHADATIAVTRVADPLQFGILVLDRRGKVRRFLEKPTWGEVFSDTVNAGIFVLQRRVLEVVPRTEALDFAADLFPRLLAAGAALHGFEAEGYWRDIGDPDSYAAAHLDFFRGQLPVTPPGVASREGGRTLWIDGESEIDPSAELRGAVAIASGCRVGSGARLEDVVLGPATTVGEGADLRRCVAWDGVRIGRSARVEAAVLCSGVEIGEECTVETGTVIGDGTVLGREVRVKEGVRIWPAKTVEAHAVVHSNLVWAERWRTSAFEEGAVTGLTNLELTPEVAARLGAAYGTLLRPESTVLSVRDAHAASRMLRRAFFGGVGSTGVHLVDLGHLPVQVMRHKLESFGEVGGVSFAQVQAVRGMTSIRFFDDRGLDISTSFAKSVERVFLREEFRRAPHERIGAIFEQPRILDFYAESYLRAVDAERIRGRRFRLVVDYAHSPAVVVLPRLLAELGCEVVSLNAVAEGARGDLPTEDATEAHRRLGTIVSSLGADLGVWLQPSGERLAVAGPHGRVWTGLDLTAVLVALLAAAGRKGSEVVLPVYAPSTFRSTLEAGGLQVSETLSAPRAMTEASRRPGVVMATAGDGDFIFPELHHAPDALFAVAKLLELLACSERSIDDASAAAPEVPVASADLPCPLERKGEVMRRFTDAELGHELSFLDGVRVALDGGWILLRPDRVGARLHLHAESRTRAAADRLLRRYLRRIEALIRRGEAR